MPALSEWRRSNGEMTQDALGEKLGVTGVTVSRWETGQRRIDDNLLDAVSEHTGIHRLKLRPDLARLVEAAE